MGWWSDIFFRRTTDWTYGVLDAAQVPDGLASAPVEPNTSYINVFIHSLRIRDVRKGISKFYGTVHSFITIPPAHVGGSGVFQMLTTPGELRDLDADKVDRVLMLDKRALGPVPYRGGDVELEIGLFSVKSADLAQPFLTVLEDLATKAGVAFVDVAKPFVEPLTTGIGLLTGSADASVLEIGLAQTMNPVKTGYYVVMRAPRGVVDIASLMLAKDGKLLDASGKVIDDWPYMVLRITASETQPNWHLIPDVATAYDLLGDAVRRQNQVDAREALSAFKVAVKWSPDLLDADADVIVAAATKKVAETLTARQLSTGAEASLPPLRELIV
jgi:hypothetical protein